MDIISFSYGIIAAGSTIITAMSIHSFFEINRISKNINYIYNDIKNTHDELSNRIDHLGEIVAKLEQEKQEKKLIKG